MEMGMNHAGEIRTLAKIAKPQVGVVTNVGWAHVENFDSIEGIAAAKRELIEELGPNGTAVLNADDPRVAAFAEICERAGAVYWLNPEPRRFWNEGDSVIARYAPLCTQVRECRTLRQIADFVESLTVGSAVT